jgi:hypothetical protein
MARAQIAETDGFGRVLQACPHCGYVAPVPRVTIGVRAELLLPEVKNGELRCQACAKGVAGDARFCDRPVCVEARAAAAARAVAAASAPSIEQAPPSTPNTNQPVRHYGPRKCAGRAGRCQNMFTPTGPRSKYGPCCPEG